MEYIKDKYKVKINRGVHYTQLKVYNLFTNKLIYENLFLPVCEDQIEAENNAERIVDINIFSK